MQKYLYSFGYETPTNNVFEESLGFVIEADSKEQAYEWGLKLAKEFLKVLFNDPNLGQGFSEGEVETEWKLGPAKRNIAARYGEIPDMEKILTNLYGPRPW